MSWRRPMTNSGQKLAQPVAVPGGGGVLTTEIGVPPPSGGGGQPVRERGGPGLELGVGAGGVECPDRLDVTEDVGAEGPGGAGVVAEEKVGLLLDLGHGGVGQANAPFTGHGQDHGGAVLGVATIPAAEGDGVGGQVEQGQGLGEEPGVVRDRLAGPVAHHDLIVPSSHPMPQGAATGPCGLLTMTPAPHNG